VQFDKEFYAAETNMKYTKKMDRIVDNENSNVATDLCVVCDFSDQKHYYISGTDDGQLRVYDKIPQSTLESPSYHETRIHQRAIIKLYFVREKSNNFLISLGEEGTIFIM